MIFNKNKNYNYFVFILFLVVILTSILYFIQNSYEHFLHDNLQDYQISSIIEKGVSDSQISSIIHNNLKEKFQNNFTPSINITTPTISNTPPNTITPSVQDSKPTVYTTPIINNQYPLNGFKIQDPNNGYFLTLDNNKYIETNQSCIASKFNIIVDDLNLDKNSIGIQNSITGKFLRSNENGNIIEDDFIPNNSYFSWILQKTGKDLYVIYSKYHNKYISFDGNNVILATNYTEWRMKIIPDINITINSNYENFSNF